jgi:hypothetical protein
MRQQRIEIAAQALLVARVESAGDRSGTNLIHMHNSEYRSIVNGRSASVFQAPPQLLGAA